MATSLSCLRVFGATCHRALQFPSVTQSETPHPVWPDRLLHSGAQSGSPTALGLGVTGLVLEVGVRGSGVRGRGLTSILDLDAMVLLTYSPSTPFLCIVLCLHFILSSFPLILTYLGLSF